MKMQYSIFSGALTAVQDYEATSKALGSAIEVILADNRNANTSFIDCALYDENKRRGISSPETLCIRRSNALIAEYVESVVLSAVEEHMNKHGSLQMPGDGDNDYIFDDEIIQKYEILDDYVSKDEYDKYGYFKLEMIGSLLETFQRHGCESLSISVYFHGELGLDFIRLTKSSDILDSFIRVEVENEENVLVPDLVALADHLLDKKNNHAVNSEIG